MTLSSQSSTKGAAGQSRLWIVSGIHSICSTIASVFLFFVPESSRKVTLSASTIRFHDQGKLFGSAHVCALGDRRHKYLFAADRRPFDEDRGDAVSNLAIFCPPDCLASLTEADSTSQRYRSPPLSFSNLAPVSIGFAGDMHSLLTKTPSWQYPIN